MRNWFGIHHFIIFSFPSELLRLLSQARLSLSVCQAHLKNGHLWSPSGVRVGLAVELLSKLLDVNILDHRRAVEVECIESISQVLKANKDFALSHWISLVLDVV